MYDMQKIDTIKGWLGSGSINIFGLPLAGKDSQGKILTELLGGNFISSGDILRGHTMPDHIKELMKTGELIPTDDFIDIVLPHLAKDYLNGKPLILSSVGRWHGEEDGVIQALSQSNHELKSVIFLEISLEESHRRREALSINDDRQNRHDDKEDILKIRFDEFNQKTLPVIRHYQGMDLVDVIDGNRSRIEVTHNIIDCLYNKVN